MRSIHPPRWRGWLCALAVTAFACGAIQAQPPAPSRVIAFPGAEGFGRFALGGRGGDVYHVTNLDDDGAGSLRHGIKTASGPRTIVFEVSGTIELKSPLLIDKSRLTIAGQTAPGDGITLKDHTLRLKGVTDVVVRYLRVRLGDKNKPPGGYDTMTTEDFDRVIFDHISASWGVDAIHDFRRGANFTLQWSILSEALARSIHPEGPHAMLGSYRSPTGNLTLHHNLFATSRDRHPTLGSGGEGERPCVVDFRNNVVYNWSGATNFSDHFVNAINNVWRPGPETDPARPPIAVKGVLPASARGHMSGNVFEGSEAWTRDNYAALDFETWRKPPSYRFAGTLADWRQPAPDLGEDAPAMQPAAAAAELVLTRAGASLVRDAVDRRLIAGVRERTGKLINSQDEVGGWPRLRSQPAPRDTDRDGMPNTWETARRLNPSNPDDRNGDDDGDGFTNLEEYLHERAQLITLADFKPPYPPSPVIARVTFDDATAREEAEGSDIWPITWADDDHLYTPWGDGGGFGGTNSAGRVKLGVARVEGGKRDYRGVNLAGGKGAPNPAPCDGKSEGILALGNTLYMWRDNDRGPGTPEYFMYFDLWRSDDHGHTWREAGVKFATRDGDYPAGDVGMFAPAFCQFGRGYAGARDDYVYIYAPDIIDPSHWLVRVPGRINLLRVPRAKIESKADYEFFAGHDANGALRWSREIGARQPVWRDPKQGTHRIAVSYNPALKRYLLTTIAIDRRGWMTIYDAPEPWGPWTHVHTELNPERWGTLTIIFSFVNKWLSPDGRDFVLVHTKDDRWATIEGRFELRR